MRIYLASPLGFSEVGRHFYYGVLIPELVRLGHDVIDPWKLTDPSKIKAISEMTFDDDRRQAWRKLNAEIGQNNINAINGCDVLFAILDGTDVDSGTAAEIGYAFGLKKPIVGYRGDFRLSSDNEASLVNIQVECFILKSGGEIITSLEDVEPSLKKMAEIVRPKLTPG